MTRTWKVWTRVTMTRKVRCKFVGKSIVQSYSCQVTCVLATSFPNNEPNGPLQGHHLMNKLPVRTLVRRHVCVCVCRHARADTCVCRHARDDMCVRADAQQMWVCVGVCART
jgi:hypothetical protein